MSNQTQDDRLWTDDRINMYAWNASSAWEARRIFEAMAKVRDTYEPRLAAVIAERDALHRELSDITAWGQACDDVRSEVEHERDQLRQRVAELEARNE